MEYEIKIIKFEHFRDNFLNYSSNMTIASVMHNECWKPYHLFWLKNSFLFVFVFQKQCRVILCAIMRTIASKRQWVLYNLKDIFWYLI